MRAVVLLLILLTGCATVALPKLPAPPPPDTLLFTEGADPLIRLCVPVAAGMDYPFTCMLLEDFRKLLRGRRYAQQQQ